MRDGVAPGGRRYGAGAGVAVLALAGAVFGVGGGNVSASDAPGATPRTPAGWAITPAGRQVDVQRLPLGLTATPDGRHVVVSADSGANLVVFGAHQALTVVDARTLEASTTPAANLYMGVAVGPEGRGYASGGNANRVFRFRLVGSTAVHEDATEAPTLMPHNLLDNLASTPTGSPPAGAPAGDGIRVPGYPGNAVLDGRHLYVVGNLAEPGGSPSACPGGQPVCSRLTVIDTRTDAVVARVPVGRDAYGVTVDRARGRAYVSNWGDEAGRGGAGGGTVSIVDVSDPTSAREVATVGVGHHPSALQLSVDGTRLFVANTNDDTLSVLDTTTLPPRVVATESVGVPGAPVGTHPNALALSPDGSTLFVALAGLNAVELRDGRTGRSRGPSPEYIPTGWYPSALAVTPAPAGEGYRLWIANAKGTGPGPGTNWSYEGSGTGRNGTVSVVDLPASRTQLRAYTEAVRRNANLDRAGAGPCEPAEGVRLSEVLCPPKGRSRPIRHVVYILTENKTFDQYFGDLDPRRWDADPTHVLFGREFTPNHHALAERYSLSDRFFSDADVSLTGHAWATGGIATDYFEKLWHTTYGPFRCGTFRSRCLGQPSRGAEADAEIHRTELELHMPEGGLIFEAFRRAGAQPPGTPGADLTMGIYAVGYPGPGNQGSPSFDPYRVADWDEGTMSYFDTCRALQFIHGQAPNGPVPGEAAPVFGDCEGRSIPDAFSLRHWTEVWEATGQDVMPNFIYMTLPNNHTKGTNLGSPTPQSMVADNDYAIGLIVEALSKSPFWESTAVFQIEDDTQEGSDHVSALRDYLQVSSPWAAPRPNHQWGSFGSLLRTIESIFDVPPMTLYDAVAVPQHEAFVTRLTDPRDTAPYTAVRPKVPFALNEPGAPGQATSMAMNWDAVDLIDEQTLNLVLESVMRGVPFDELVARSAASGPRQEGD